SLQLDSLSLGLGFHDVRLHLRSFQRGQRLPLLDDATPVHVDFLYEACHLGVNRDSQIRQNLSRQTYFPFDGFRLNRNHLYGRLRRERRNKQQGNEESMHVHNTCSMDLEDLATRCRLRRVPGELHTRPGASSKSPWLPP